MTKKFHQMIHCPNCGKEITAETDFGRWIRNNKNLDSVYGYVFSDIDLPCSQYIVHRYKNKYERKLQYLMWIEIKTRGTNLTISQQDTITMISQCLRNRRKSIHKEKIPYQMKPVLNRVYSKMLKKYIHIKLFGFHLIQFSGNGPEDSDVILWDWKKITLEQLVGLLRFDIDPDNLRKMDNSRIHHKETHEIFDREGKFLLDNPPTRI